MKLEFNSAGDARDWADQWVRAHIPAAVQEELATFEAEHLQRFLTDYGRGHDQFYVQYDALVRLVDEVNFIDKTDWPGHRVPQYVLLAKNLKALHSAMDRLSKGFYQDAVTLLRGSYDAFLRAVHISCYPADPYAVLVDKPPAGTTRFNATNLVESQLRLNWRFLYQLMSVFAHANTFEALKSLREMQDGYSERFGLTFEDDKALRELAFPFLQLVLLAFLRFVLEVIIGAGAMSIDEPGLISTSQESVQLLTYGFDHHEKERWPQLSADLDYVFEIISVADAGGDWTVLRDKRPPVMPSG